MSEYKNHNYYSPNENIQNNPVDTFDVDEEVYTVSTTQKGEKGRKNPMRRGMEAYKSIIALAICVCIAFLIAYIISNYLIRPTRVDGDSMSYNLEDGDVLILDLVSYKFSKPSRFDIVVFKPADEKNFIKRVIGLPGEKVQIKDGQIYINDELLNENFGYGALDEAGVAKEPVILGEDEYFVLGDFRRGSIDSRNPYVGNVKEDTIVGRAMIRIWPLRSIGSIDNEKNSRIQAGKDE